jgi:hypothetical protein
MENDATTSLLRNLTLARPTPFSLLLVEVFNFEQPRHFELLTVICFPEIAMTTTHLELATTTPGDFKFSGGTC